MNPIKAFLTALGQAFWYGSQRKTGRPGELISRLSDEEREALRNLSAQDVNKTFIYEGKYFPYHGKEWQTKTFYEDFSKELMEKDKTFNKNKL